MNKTWLIIKREYLTRVLAQSKTKKGEIAKALGISRKSLWEKVKAYGIEAARDRDDS